MVDIKKLLYKTKQMEQARHNALIAIQTLEQREQRMGNDVNWYIRGSGHSNPVMSRYLMLEDSLERIARLVWIVEELNIIIDAISRAHMTLNDEQRELIKLRYFDDEPVISVCMKMHMKETKYHHMHKIALKAMEACLNPLCITEQFMDALLFTPYQERHDSTDVLKTVHMNAAEKVEFTNRMKEGPIQDFEKKMRSLLGA